MDAQEYKRKRKRKGSLVMNKDVYGILGDLTAEILLEIIAECMDDYLYVIDLQNNKMEISQSALDRFMISETHVRNVKQEIMSVVYEEDRTMFAKHMQAVMDGKEKVHDIHYRWLDKNGLPVWVNCRGVVIDDEDGKPGYLVGCLNETGNQRRADNVTGLLGGMEFCAYLRSQKKPVTTGFLMHIGIDDFATVNETHGSNYGDYVLKSVADCMKECLSGNQRLYHLVADQYVIVDLDSTSMDDAIQLKKKIGEKIDEFIISEKYEVVFVNEYSNEFLKAYKFAREKMGMKSPRLGYYCGDINDLLRGEQRKELEKKIQDMKKEGLVGFVGGPPCPDFSIAGKNEGISGKNGMLTNRTGTRFFHI